MNMLEEFSVAHLKEFVKNAVEDGICHNGYDIDQRVQELVVNVVEQYIDEVEHGDL